MKTIKKYSRYNYYRVGEYAFYSNWGWGVLSDKKKFPKCYKYYNKDCYNSPYYDFCMWFATQIETA